MYILFIDFEKAYDKVVRGKLIEELKKLGCGQIMLKIIIVVYRKTTCLFRKRNDWQTLFFNQLFSIYSLC